MADSRIFRVCDVLFLERELAGLPYPTGYWVVCGLTEATARLAPVGNDENGLIATEGEYIISVEDLGAFTRTGDTARIPPRRA